MSTAKERWQNEVRAGYRWGREKPELFPKGLPRELEELETLWQAGGPSE